MPFDIQPIVDLRAQLLTYGIPYIKYISINLCFSCQAEIERSLGIKEQSYPPSHMGQTVIISPLVLNRVAGFSVKDVGSDNCLLCNKHQRKV